MRNILVLLVLAICIQACSPRRYSSRTTWFNRTSKSEVVKQKSDVSVDHEFVSPESTILEVVAKDHDVKSLDDTKHLPNVIDSIADNFTIINLYTQFKRVADPSLISVVKKPEGFKHRLKVLKKPRHKTKQQDDTLLGILIIIVVIAWIFGIILLLNHFFFHMAMKELMRSILAAFFGILILSLLIVLIIGPDSI